MEREGEGLSIYLRRSKRRRHLPEIWTFLLKDRQTGRNSVLVNFDLTTSSFIYLQ